MYKNRIIRKKSILALLGLGLLGSACTGGERHPNWERDRRVIGPIALKSRLAYIDGARDRVLSIETAGGDTSLHSYAIGRNAIYALPSPDQTQLAVLTRGEEAIERGQIDEEPMLWMVELENKGEKAQSYSLGSAFDRVTIANNGETAVAYFSAGGFDETTGVFRNPNEVAVVDLGDDDGPSNPTLRTLRSFGSAPDGVVLSPPMVIPGAEDETPRVFALILAKNTVTILDATHPERKEVTLRLGNASGPSINPQEVVFAPNSGSIYVRSSGATDVLAILLQGEAQENDLDNDYQPVLAELGAGAGPSDIAVYNDAIDRRFVLASMPSRNQVALIDGDTAEFSLFQTPEPIDRIMLFPNEPGVPPRVALLASLSGRSNYVHLLPLEGLNEALQPTNLESIELAEPVLDVVAVPNSERALIVHDADRTVLGLLDLGLGAVSPLEGVGRLDSFAFSTDGSYLVGATMDAEQVGILDLASLHPSNMRIDDTPSQVFALHGGAIAIDHGDAFGRVTLMPNRDSTRQESVLLSGFLLSDYLDEDYE